MNDLIAPWCLAVATLLGEAGSEPYLGQVAVAKTIRNRMRMRHFSDGTVAGTVLRPLQFSLWNSSVNGRDSGRTASCKANLDDPRVRQVQLAWFESAAKNAELGPAFDRVVLYHADYVKPDWAARAVMVRQIGHHLFYRER